MEGLFINKKGNSISTSMNNTRLSLLASHGGFEVMQQVLNPKTVAWITPADDKDTTEFFFLIEGSLVLMPDTEAIQMNVGDSFYANGITEDILIQTTAVTTLLYITNRPLFNDVLSFQGDLIELMKKVDEKDNYTYIHSRNVMNYSLLLFRKLYPNEPYNDITTASLFHDVGKCLVPDEILKKPGRLTDAEFAQMMKHPAYSARLLKTNFGEKVADIARAHHERLDGSGYPYGLMGDEIPIESKIIAVADSFDAMTTKRVYKNYVKTFEDAAKELFELSNLYDESVTCALMELVHSGEIDLTQEQGV